METSFHIARFVAVLTIVVSTQRAKCLSVWIFGGMNPDPTPITAGLRTKAPRRRRTRQRMPCQTPPSLKVKRGQPASKNAQPQRMPSLLWMGLVNRRGLANQRFPELFQSLKAGCGTQDCKSQRRNFWCKGEWVCQHIKLPSAFVSGTCFSGIPADARPQRPRKGRLSYTVESRSGSKIEVLLKAKAFRITRAGRDRAGLLAASN